MQAVVAVDLDGDGALDLASADKGSNAISVLLNDGTARFGHPVSYPVGLLPAGITAADLDGDLDADLAVTNRGSGTVSVLLNQGDGTFSAGVELPAGLEPSAIASGDLNRDGAPDLVASNFRSRTVSVLFNDGLGGFTAGPVIGVGSEPVSIVISDLDRNGTPDLAVLNRATEVRFLPGSRILPFSIVTVLPGNGDGTFGPSSAFEVAQNPFQLIAHDLNGDGWPDLATANHLVSSLSPGSWISVLRNDRLGGFFPEQKVPTTPGFDASLDAADLDGDGAPDLVAAGHWTPGEVEVMLNDGTGTFAPPAGFAPGGLNAPSSVVTGDFDLDGDQDVIAASDSSDNFVLLANQLIPNPPRPAPGTADLLATVSRMRARAKNGMFEFEIEAVISNVGSGATGGLFSTGVYLSDDPILDASDTLVARLYTLADLPAGATDKQKSKRLLSASPSGQFILLVVDEGDQITELDESNNVTSAVAP